MASTVYILSKCLLLLFGKTLADVADDIVAKTFLTTGVTQYDDTLLKLLPEIPSGTEPPPANDTDNQSTVTKEESSPARGDDIVISYSSDVLEPYAEQAASLGDVAIRYISIQRLSGTGEYCAAANECASKVCILNRCCGSTRSICRKLDCTVDPQKQCYIEDLPCTSQFECHVNPTCDYINPCIFAKCSAGYHCKVVNSCILPPRAQCAPTGDPCGSILCPPNSVCSLQGTYPAEPTCNIQIN